MHLQNFDLFLHLSHEFILIVRPCDQSKRVVAIPLKASVTLSCFIRKRILSNARLAARVTCALTSSTTPAMQHANNFRGAIGMLVSHLLLKPLQRCHIYDTGGTRRLALANITQHTSILDSPKKPCSSTGSSVTEVSLARPRMEVNVICS
eukprot:jgi/Botrbrau1/5510/Bobra.27_1s0047.1